MIFSHQLFSYTSDLNFSLSAIGNVCYHFLALPSVGHVRNKQLRESIFQVLGTLVRSYGHSLSCSLKMIQVRCTYLMKRDNTSTWTMERHEARKANISLSAIGL